MNDAIHDNVSQTEKKYDQDWMIFLSFSFYLIQVKPWKERPNNEFLISGEKK